MAKKWTMSKKWTYEEIYFDAFAHGDGKNAEVHREFRMYGAPLEELPQLVKVIQDMTQGLGATEPRESYFAFYKKSARSKVRWDADFVIVGSRAMTSQEKAEWREENKEEFNRREKEDLATLRRIKKQNPHLFDKA